MDFDLDKIPFYKKALSYIKPVWLKNEHSVLNPGLELLLYNGRFQLATNDALYSDGEHYTPAVSAVNRLKPYLPGVKSVLVLGVGLGSIVQVIKKNGFDPRFTLVEIDKVILKLALEFLSTTSNAVMEPICADAKDFIEKNKDKFDLIFIDIFDSRTVPQFVSSPTFLTLCRGSLTPGGRVVWNYIINDEQEWKRTLKEFSAIFPDNEIIQSDTNRIFIAKA